MKINIEKTIGYALHHSSYLFKGAIKQALRRAGYDITPEEFVLLNIIPGEGIDQGELVKKSLKDKTNITRLLTRMEQKGLLKRREHRSSGRQQTIVLTAAGEDARLLLLPVVQKTVAAATDGISAEEIQLASKVLMKLCSNLKNT